MGQEGMGGAPEPLQPTFLLNATATSVSSPSPSVPARMASVVRQHAAAAAVSYLRAVSSERLDVSHPVAHPSPAPRGSVVHWQHQPASGPLSRAGPRVRTALVADQLASPTSGRPANVGSPVLIRLGRPCRGSWTRPLDEYCVVAEGGRGEGRGRSRRDQACSRPVEDVRPRAQLELEPERSALTETGVSNALPGATRAHVSPGPAPSPEAARSMLHDGCPGDLAGREAAQ